MSLVSEDHEKNPALLEWIRPVEDPEMRLSVVDLGLIYVAQFNDPEQSDVRVEMTLTSPHCPVADQFISSVKNRVLEFSGVKSAEVKLVFEPKWDPKTMASDDVKDRLGIW